LNRAMERALLEKMEQAVADVFVIMLDCGMRPEEVMRSRWEDVHWDRSQVFIPWGKTPESRRFVPMSDRMRDRLRAREQGAKGPWVFPRFRVNWLPPQGVHRLIPKKISPRCGEDILSCILTKSFGFSPL
jgi:integrase